MTHKSYPSGVWEHFYIYLRIFIYLIVKSQAFFKLAIIKIKIFWLFYFFNFILVKNKQKNKKSILADFFVYKLKKKKTKKSKKVGTKQSLWLIWVAVQPNNFGLKCKDTNS